MFSTGHMHQEHRKMFLSFRLNKNDEKKKQELSDGLGICVLNLLVIKEKIKFETQHK